jgi:hypothetical protein
MLILLKTFELFQKPFGYLFNAEYLSPQVKAELKQAAVADALIGGTIADYNQPPSTTTAKKLISAIDRRIILLFIYFRYSETD